MTGSVKGAKTPNFNSLITTYTAGVSGFEPTLNNRGVDRIVSLPMPNPING